MSRTTQELEHEEEEDQTFIQDIFNRDIRIRGVEHELVCVMCGCECGCGWGGSARNCLMSRMCVCPLVVFPWPGIEMRP